ncbi:peptide-methionine (R)-S-oxide reductase [Sphingobium lactosutens]|uniref:peptide-methionine (R)-S-oxide reductase MsrB n=1 Tax=Sphingobium lactosutens TaxID=522773 RepID=UPI0015BFF636|nr:peptide-methionine (R)-S-oxide reductase MsrB [Sphingobium lactosutens]NWK94947.1 peptide-methionine (R)-S-oxide reductase [Sphingobium lactosutens]
MNRRHFLSGVATGVTAIVLLQILPDAAEAAYPFTLTDAQWRKRLSPWGYKVLRQQATEHPFTSSLNDEHRAGLFACAGCGQKLFSSKTKFDSGTGWPSFWAALPRAVGTSRDLGLGEVRTEVHCARCGGHLGHVFDDGPRPTGKRYCMNGVALSFLPA